MRVLAVVQARMSSTRLPGKVLRPLGGRPILGHILDRLKACSTISEIALAVPATQDDIALVRFAAEEGIAIFRGSEENVLERFALAVDTLDPDIIVRVTGDSPILEPALIDHMVRRLIEDGGDYVQAAPGTSCAQEGVDPLSRRAFERLRSEAGGDPVAREHVTGYFKHRPGFARATVIEIDEAYRLGGARLSIDAPADLAFHEAVMERLGGRVPELGEMVALLKREPWLMTTNAHVRQKAVSDLSGVVLVRADGGAELGLGHLRRTLALAAALRDEAGLGVLFLTGVDPRGSAETALAMITRAGFAGMTPQPAESEDMFLERMTAMTPARALVLDVRTALESGALKRLGLPIITIDDASERRLAADLAVFPPVAQVNELDWTGFEGRLVADWSHVPLVPPAASPARPETAATGHVFVSMGGTNPRRWTEKAVSAIASVAAGRKIKVAIGPGAKEAQALAAQLSSVPGVSSQINPDGIAPLAQGADLALVSYGVTALELAALGVPALYLCLSADHRRSAEAAAAAGFGRIAAGPGPVDWMHVAGLARALLADKTLRTQMSEAGRTAIDGRGASRLAGEILDLIKRDAAGREAHRLRAQRPSPSRRAAQGE